MDNINRVQSALFTANRWLGLRVETLGAFIASAAALAVVMGRWMRTDLDPEASKR